MSAEQIFVRDLLGMYACYGFLCYIIRKPMLRLYFQLRGPMKVSNTDATKSNSEVLLGMIHSTFVFKMILVALPFMRKEFNYYYLCFWSYHLLLCMLYSLRFKSFQPFAIKYGLWFAWQFTATSTFAYVYIGLFDISKSEWVYWYTHFVPPLYVLFWLSTTGRKLLLQNDRIQPIIVGYWTWCYSLFGSYIVILLYLYFFEPKQTYKVEVENIPWKSGLAGFIIGFATQVYMMFLVIVSNRCKCK